MAERHPAGNFRAEILDHGWSESSTGTPQFTVKFQTEHGHVNGYFPMTDRAAEHTLRKIRAMGYEGDDLDDLADGSVLKGCFCQIQVTHETHNGKTSAKVGFVDPDGYVPGVKKSAGAAANARRFNGLLKKITTSTTSAGDDSKPPF